MCVAAFAETPFTTPFHFHRLPAGSYRSTAVSMDLLKCSKFPFLKPLGFHDLLIGRGWPADKSSAALDSSRPNFATRSSHATMRAARIRSISDNDQVSNTITLTQLSNCCCCGSHCGRRR